MGLVKENREFRILLIAWSLAAFAFGCFLPMISVFLSNQFQYSASEVGLFFLATSVFRGYSQVAVGNYSDVTGRKKIMLVTQFIRFGFLILLAGLIYFHADKGIQLVFVLVVFVFTSIFQPIAMAALSDVLPAGEYMHGFGIFRIAGNIGWMLGPLLGGWAAEISFALCFAISGIFSLFSGIVLFLFKENPHFFHANREGRLPFAHLLKDRKFLIFCIISFLSMITISQFISTLPHFWSSRLNFTKTELGFLFGINGLTILIVQAWVIRMVSRFKFLLGLSVGCFLYFFCYFVAGFTSEIYQAAILIFAISFSESMIHPLSQTSVHRLSPETTVGRYMGFFAFVSVIAWSIGPLVGGLILDFIPESPRLAWAMISSFAFIAGCLFWFSNVFGYLDKKKEVIG